MSLTEKIKITDLSKSFGIANKDVITMLSKFGETPKSPSKVLTQEELDYLFDSITLANQVEEISEALNATVVEKPPEPEKTVGVSAWWQKGCEPWRCAVPKRQKRPTPWWKMP